MEQAEVVEKLLEAAEMHVPFDGWSDKTFTASCLDAEIDESFARLFLPQGGRDLAIEAHRKGDQNMITALANMDLSELRFRDKIAAAVMVRLECAGDKESVRRATTLFALPQNAAIGAKLIWGTCDAIWSSLGDPSRDYNWYSKRATLSGVYGSTVLYWLGDTSDDDIATKEFINRRIDNVMQIEKAKGQIRKSPSLMKLLSGPRAMLRRLNAPDGQTDLPGYLNSISKETP